MNYLQATRHQPRGNKIVLISLLSDDEREVLEEEPPLIDYEQYTKVLKMNFDDIDHEETAKQHQLKIIDEAQAKQLYDFIVDAILDTSVTNIIVHCHAGISRSAAVALFIKEYFINNENYQTLPEKYVNYNRRVYSELLRQHIIYSAKE